MLQSLYELSARAKQQVVDDIRSDPHLLYILGVAAVLAGFWFWHRIPNFATRDERDRVFDVLVAYGTFLNDPGIESLRDGISWGRVPFAATFYLYAIALLPVIVVTVLVGGLDIVVAFDHPDPTFGFWNVWHETPEWFWTLVLAIVRLTSVALAVGSVYLTYRIGALLRDRLAGRLSATVLTLTYGFLVVAHEGGEDMPALFFILLALYLVLRYVETGDTVAFLSGCVSGGVALAFKLTAGPIVLLIGAAYLLRARHVDDAIDVLTRPKLLVGGAALGAVTVLVGFPIVLVSGVGPLAGRVLHGATVGPQRYHGPGASILWWYLRNYLNGLGLVLFVASASSVVASLPRLRKRSMESSGTLLLLVGLGSYLLLFSTWHDLRVHHLLPTFSFLAVLLGVTLSRLTDRSPRIARPVIAVLLVTGGAYAVVGDLGYATQPRDEATAWLEQNAPENATMETYRRDLQDTAVPHEMEIYSPVAAGHDIRDRNIRCPEYIQLGYRDLFYLNPDTYARNSPSRRMYLQTLLSPDSQYEIVAEFGQRPDNYVARPSNPGSVKDAIRNGIVPQITQYGDEQEVGPDQYTLILRRTEPCLVR
ncbi:ArnT family glycosyltransferase [Halocatena pleomorpha]|uniref:Dolichyl-phosphate-mannose--protein mannosyltransferase n=1 Tax=Halocatena pleomorpha TaxID=1785090 RepID=A0A3P3RHW8_9EURY|nr:glycosyltransferase family 39 protein [Halocatena pleomorpha]RRJ32469.1 dolichyl-phosphate-mannose--protein mannosyltransferase [Halocatena pleomorpha]